MTPIPTLARLVLSVALLSPVAAWAETYRVDSLLVEVERFENVVGAGFLNEEPTVDKLRGIPRFAYLTGSRTGLYRRYDTPDIGVAQSRTSIEVTNTGAADQPVEGRFKMMVFANATDGFSSAFASVRLDHLAADGSIISTLLEEELEFGSFDPEDLAMQDGEFTTMLMPSEALLFALIADADAAFGFAPVEDDWATSFASAWVMVASVPLPGMLVLFGGILGGLVLRGRRTA